MTDVREARRRIDLAYGALDKALALPSSQSNAGYIRTARRNLVAAKNALAVREPEQAPSQAQSAFAGKGALLVNGPNANPSLLAAAGIRKVAHQITSVGSDDQATFRNCVRNGDGPADLATSRWDGFARFGWGTHGADMDAEVRMVQARVRAFGLSGYIADTERYHLNGTPQLTDTLLEKLTAVLDVPVAVVTFAYSTFSPGQLGAGASNYPAVVKRGATFIGEAYDANGVSYGVASVAAYMRAEGVEGPLVLAIGDKSLRADAQALVVLSGAVAGVWVWGPEQSGADILALNALKGVLDG